MSKVCPRCRSSNRDEARHCARCGASLAEGTGPRLCAAGRHPMDPGWSTCPYCSPGPARSTPPPTSVLNPPAPAGPGRPRRATVVEGDAAPAAAARPAAPAGGDRRTRFAPDAGAEGPSAAGTDRRVVAVLVTYTWRRAGEVFPVREGRNYLGSGPDCEVSVPADPQMSARHATIVHRGRGFWIDDEKSMNGTFVDGTSVEEKRPLPDHAEVKAGATVFSFVVLDPESTAS